MPSPPDPSGRRRWPRARAAGRVVPAVLAIALVALGVGAWLVVDGRAPGEAGPATVVQRYFAALQRGDAPAALAYGTVPAGSRSLVGSAALRDQQHLAPLRDLVVLSTRVSGTRASVQVGYQLDFASGPATIAADVSLHHDTTGWLLDASAVPTRFAFSTAGQRAAIAGRRVPDGRALVFPGAVALRFDSPYLTGTLGNDDITFGAPDTTRVDVGLTAAGRSALQERVRTALQRCLQGGDPTCPQPDGRYLPGSLRGTLDGPLHGVRITLTGAQEGLATIDAQATARAAYSRLNFTDQLRTGHGTVELDVHAETVVARAVGAAASNALRWTG